MASIFAHTCFRRMSGYNSGLNSSTPCFFKSVAGMRWLLGPYFLGRWMCGYRCCSGVNFNGFGVSCVFCDCPIISDHRYCSIFGGTMGRKKFVVESLRVRAMFLHRNSKVVTNVISSFLVWRAVCMKLCLVSFLFLKKRTVRMMAFQAFSSALRL